MTKRLDGVVYQLDKRNWWSLHSTAPVMSRTKKIGGASKDIWVQVK
jgi:hypothetical protein